MEANKNPVRYSHHLWDSLDDPFVNHHFLAISQNGNGYVKPALELSRIRPKEGHPRYQQIESIWIGSWHQQHQELSP